MPLGRGGAGARGVALKLVEVQPGGTILTDDKAPVEWLTDQMIIDYATAKQTRMLVMGIPDFLARELPSSS